VVLIESTGVLQRHEDSGLSGSTVTEGLVLRARGGYLFSYNRSYLSRDEKGEVIHLDRLVLDLPNGSILTNVDLRSGQIVVVGKTNYEKGGSSALIAVITAKLID
jgi:hypothetical protein